MVPRLNRRSVWMAILLVALTVWGLTDVRSRARTDLNNPLAHRTDLTVNTVAGAAMFDGRDPYAVSNLRGWHYHLPPLLAILVAPLSALDTQWQGVIWYAMSLVMLWGCYTECRRIWQSLCAAEDLQIGKVATTDSPGPNRLASLPNYFYWLAAATVLLPVLNCLQRGQLGILVTYFLLLGLRCVLTSRTVHGAMVAGIILALPVTVKVIPALPVGIICLQLLAVAVRHHEAAAARMRALGIALGTVGGLLMFFLIIPSLVVGPAKNVQLLRTWIANISPDQEGKFDDDFGMHAMRNQSLSNAIYRVGNWAAHVFGGTQDDQLVEALAGSKVTMPMDSPGAQWTVRFIQLCMLLLLLAAGWQAAREGRGFSTAVVFSLGCLLMSTISPVFRGHYYVLWLPAAWLLPLYCWRMGYARSAMALSASACAVIWTHYLLLEWAGRLGVLGVGATIWFGVATVFLIRPRFDAGRLMQTNSAPHLRRAA
ncbi:MAG TPA: glycosyltransferase family 87 protein [Pirellulales bacterium]|nr:glycosyltransferase family 87 protein [Pirellulales bacterium]